jgi:hypothetical protein
MPAARWFFIASVLALMGTNTQAQLSRQRLLEVADPLIAEAGGLWSPLRWIVSPARRHRRNEVEHKIRQDPESWRRYEQLRKELRAWNFIESSVAMAFGGSLLVVLEAVIG